MNPAQIIFRDAPASAAALARIQKELGRLERHGAGIEDCRVVIEVPHPHGRHGARYGVEIELRVPGKSIVVHHLPPARRLRQAAAGKTRAAEAEATHKDVYVAIRDAFAIADRLLAEHKRAAVAAVRGGDAE